MTKKNYYDWLPNQEAKIQKHPIFGGAKKVTLYQNRSIAIITYDQKKLILRNVTMHTDYYEILTKIQKKYALQKTA